MAGGLATVTMNTGDRKGRGGPSRPGRHEVGDKRVKVSPSTAVLGSARRLRTALTAAAVRAGEDYPIISDPKARRLLPELVKATQSVRQAVMKTIPAT